MSPKILMVPKMAVCITSLLTTEFKIENIIPKQAENIENKINFNHEGIGTSAKIKIINS
jgi:hypothetical protein